MEHPEVVVVEVVVEVVSIVLSFNARASFFLLKYSTLKW